MRVGYTSPPVKKDTPDTKSEKDLDNDIMPDEGDEYEKSCEHGVSLYENCEDCGGHCTACDMPLPWKDGEGLLNCVNGCDDVIVPLTKDHDD